ncbi:MAG: DUF885 family protein [Polyangiaceae bacterium]
MPSPLDYSSFAEAFHQHFSSNPNRRAQLGINRALGELPDPSLEAAKTRVRESQELVEACNALPKAELDFDQQLDLDLAALTLRAESVRDELSWGGHSRLERTPTAGDDIGDGLFTLFINDPRPAEERLADITQRVEAVPDYLGTLLGRLKLPVTRWVKMDQTKTSGLLELLDNLSGWATRERLGGSDRLATASERAKQSLLEYGKALGELRSAPDIHVGDMAMRDIISLRGIELPPEELKRVATEFLADTFAQIEELRARLAAKYDLPPETDNEQLQDFLAKRFKVTLPNNRLEDILDRYQLERGKILDYIRKHDLFPVPDDQDMLILRTPGFLEPTIPAGAMTSPAPFREGTKRSLVYLTLSDELVDEHTELSIPGMMVHEGIPGHHLQLSWGALHPSLIRKHIDAMDHAEGWTTMLEDYMLDVGYVADLEDEVRFTSKRDIARIGARVAIDLFFMSGDKSYLDVGVKCDLSSDDPFVAAGNLLFAVTGFVPGRVQAELNWYSQERGYPLSYLTGNHLVWGLKRDLERAQRGKLEGRDLDRLFHRVYLESGNMPVSFLRRVFAQRGLLG